MPFNPPQFGQLPLSSSTSSVQSPAGIVPHPAYDQSPGNYRDQEIEQDRPQRPMRKGCDMEEDDSDQPDIHVKGIQQFIQQNEQNRRGEHGDMPRRVGNERTHPKQYQYQNSRGRNPYGSKPREPLPPKEKPEHGEMPPVLPPGWKQENQLPEHEEEKSRAQRRENQQYWNNRHNLFEGDKMASPRTPGYIEHSNLDSEPYPAKGSGIHIIKDHEKFMEELNMMRPNSRAYIPEPRFVEVPPVPWTGFPKDYLEEEKPAKPKKKSIRKKANRREHGPLPRDRGLEDRQQQDWLEYEEDEENRRNPSGIGAPTLGRKPQGYKPPKGTPRARADEVKSVRRKACECGGKCEDCKNKIVQKKKGIYLPPDQDGILNVGYVYDPSFPGNARPVQRPASPTKPQGSRISAATLAWLRQHYPEEAAKYKKNIYGTYSYTGDRPKRPGRGGRRGRSGGGNAGGGQGDSGQGAA